MSLASSAQLRGESVVLAMWSTGEAITEAVAERQELDGFASAPKEVARRMLQGLGALAAELSSSEQAVEALETALEALELPVNPMDELLRRLGGPEKVAELTGRQRRPLSNGRSTRLEERGEGANLLELEAFQSGRKQVAIITEVRVSRCPAWFMDVYGTLWPFRGRECWNQPPLRPARTLRSSL